MYHPSEVELSETTKQVLTPWSESVPAAWCSIPCRNCGCWRKARCAIAGRSWRSSSFSSAGNAPSCCWMTRPPMRSDLQLQSIAHGVIIAGAACPGLRRGAAAAARGEVSRHALTAAAITIFRSSRGGLSVFPRLVAAEHGVHSDATQIKSGVTRARRPARRRTGSRHQHPPDGPGGYGQIHDCRAVRGCGGRSAAIMRRSSPSTKASPRWKRARRALGIQFDRRQQARDRSACSRSTRRSCRRASSPALVRDAVERDGARVVVIDSLNGYLNAMPDEHFLTAQLHELLTYLGRQGVTTLMVVAQHGIARHRT